MGNYHVRIPVSIVRTIVGSTNLHLYKFAKEFKSKNNFGGFMFNIEIYSVNLNIWYNSPKEVWDIIPEIYSEMAGWHGFIDNFPFWFGNESDEKYITASVEPSGLQINGKLESDEWKLWIEEFKKTATEKLGFEVGEPEDGFE